METWKGVFVKSSAMPLLDLTHTFVAGMPAYPGDPAPQLRQIADIRKEGYTDYQIKTGMHVGTHMDAPLHMIEGGKFLSEIGVETFFGEGVLIDARDKPAVDEKILLRHTVKKGNIMLVMTGFSKKFGRPEYYEKYPEITEGFADEAIRLGVKIVGMDTPSPDRPPFKVHKKLLGKEILIIENLTNLEKLLGVKSFEIFAFPAKFHAEAAPVRVVAKVP